MFEKVMKTAVSFALLCFLFFSASAAKPVQAADNHGLRAEYYEINPDDNFSFGKLKSVGISKQLNFEDLDFVLMEHLGQDELAGVRWTGTITPQYSEEYTFSALGDNGYRVWINNELVFDHWVDDVSFQDSAPIQLEAGKKYDIKVEYFEGGSLAQFFLAWSSTSEEWDIVPESAYELPQVCERTMSGHVTAEGDVVELKVHTIADLTEILDHIVLKTETGTLEIEEAELDEEESTLYIKLPKHLEKDEAIAVQYDGNANLENLCGLPIAEGEYPLVNQSEYVYVDYTPFDVQLSLSGTPKTDASFTWKTNYKNETESKLDSIVEIVLLDEDFGSDSVMRFQGQAAVEGSVLNHTVLAKSLKPGTAYKYRVGSEGHWSEAGTFTTEAAPVEETEQPNKPTPQEPTAPTAQQPNAADVQPVSSPASEQVLPRTATNTYNSMLIGGLLVLLGLLALAYPKLLKK